MRIALSAQYLTDLSHQDMCTEETYLGLGECPIKRFWCLYVPPCLAFARIGIIDAIMRAGTWRRDPVFLLSSSHCDY